MIENPNQDTTSVSGSHDNSTHAERRGETGNHPCRAGRRFTPTACWSASCFGDAASKEAGTQGTHSFAWAHKIPLTKFSWGQRFQQRDKIADRRSVRGPCRKDRSPCQKRGTLVHLLVVRSVPQSKIYLGFVPQRMQHSTECKQARTDLIL